jgi:hypothetical protein
MALADRAEKTSATAAAAAVAILGIKILPSPFDFAMNITTLTIVFHKRQIYTHWQRPLVRAIALGRRDRHVR